MTLCTVSSAWAAKADAAWTDPKVVKWAKEFYDSLKKGLPVLMAYRWHSQVLANLTNKQGRSVTDYSEDNDVTIKAIPIMDVSKMVDTFRGAFDINTFNNGSSSGFNDQCVIDLNPASSAYSDLLDG